MEFEELKKVWDAQREEVMYVINEKALHNRILSKKKTGEHITNWSELAVILVNIAAGAAVLTTTLLKSSGNLFMFLMGGWMLFTAVYFIVKRALRTRADRKFDRSLLGDLDHALSTATYQVHLSQLNRWNILPIAAFSIFGILGSGKSIWIVAGVLLFFAITHFAARWEHGIYERKKAELELLKRKLQEENGKD